MNWDQIAGNWKMLKGKAQQKWGDMTDDDLEAINGRKEELIGRLQVKYGMTKEEAERAAETWSKDLTL